MTQLSPRWVPPDARGGVFTVAQALASGASAGAVRYRLASGTWTRVVGRGIRLAADPPHRRTDAYAAWLTWPNAVLCRESALRFHLPRLPAELRERPVHVWVSRPMREVGGLVPHRFRLPVDDVVDRDGGRVTTVERAAVDTLAGLGARDAGRLIAWLFTRNVLSREHLLARLETHPKMWGNVQLRRLAELTRGGALSPAEQKLHGILRAAGLTGWQPNMAVFDAMGVIGSVDVLFDAVRVAIEVDGRAYHGVDQFQSDRERDNRLVGAGYVVLHFTWEDLLHRPDVVIHQVRAALSRSKNAQYPL